MTTASPDIETLTVRVRRDTADVGDDELAEAFAEARREVRAATPLRGRGDR